MGSVYPANGFIYGWTDTGVRIAQPRFKPDDAQDWSMLNATAYFWALPQAERKQAFAAAGVLPAAASSSHGRPILLLDLPAGALINAGALVQPFGVSRLDAGPGGRSGFAGGRYAVQWVAVTR